MFKYRGTFSVDTNVFRSLDGVYHIGEYTLIPCEQSARNRQRGCSNFVVQFDFDGLDEKGIADSSKQGKNSLANLLTGTKKAKTFISWLVTCTRTWARVSSDSAGSMTRTGPADHVSVEDYDEQGMDLVFHAIKVAKQGEFVRVERPEFGVQSKDGSTFRLPSDFPALTQKLYSLRVREKNKFLNACFAYQFALENWGLYPTVSIVALVSSVESIMANEYSSGFCDVAQQPCSLKQDVVKKFRKFFENNLQYPLPDTLAKFLNNAYTDRSNFVHISLLGENEMHGMYYSFSEGEGRRLMDELEKLEEIVNAGLIEWLKRI